MTIVRSLRRGCGARVRILAAPDRERADVAEAALLCGRERSVRPCR